ncbi:MAG: cytochrome c1, partial [Colwellia sp.]|nr:cytochrome c1 [Colwellia sp.]
YTYLRSFYLDSERPFGVNNKVFKDVGMPHVLQDLQGVSSIDEQGHLSPAMGGGLSPEEYDVVVRDLTNFLEYVGEPSKLERKSMGVKVLIFLLIFFIIAYFLKKEYWKDIH